MLAIHAEKIGKLAILECKGRILSSDDVFRLRDVVLAHGTACVIGLDLSEIKVIGSAGVGMLSFLETWAQQRNIRFKLFDPSRAVVEGLVQNRSILDFEIAGFHEMMSILEEHQRPQRLVA